MNVTEIELTNFGSWGHVRLRIEPGCTLIQGANGAGKSTLLTAIEFCLYGATSDAGRLIRRGTDCGTVRAVIVVAFGTLIVERKVRRSGRGASVSLSLEKIHDEESIESLTAATTGETQDRLAGMLGVDRETWRASAYSAQGDGASFCEAKPADRKRILSNILGLDVWTGLHADARAQALEAKRAADAARGALELVDGAERRLAEMATRLGGARADLALAENAEAEAETEAGRLASEAEAAREARRQHQAAVEAAERARADRERATGERRAADEALQRAKDAAANAPSVEDAEAEYTAASFAYATLQQEQTDASRKLAKHREQVTEAERHRDAAATGHRRYVEESDALQLRLARASAGICNECGQPLVSDEAKALVERLADALDAANTEAANTEEALNSWSVRLAYLAENAPATPDEAALRETRERDAQSRVKREEAKTIQSLAGSIEAAQQRARDAMDREMQTAEALRDANAQNNVRYIDEDAEAKHLAALDVVTHARLEHHQAAADLATAEAAAQQAERDAAAEQAARQRVTEAERTEATESILAAGFGPSGTPALILENSALPALEAEANRVLGELNAPVRIELRSQKLLASSDRVADTLDIVVLMDALEAPYETLSGGERTRVALALRAALTRLLASKRAARVRLLVVDEPAGLDAAGCEQLALVLEEFVQAGIFETVILVTHQAELADQIARVVRVERAPGGESRLATGLSTRVPVEEAVDA